MLLFRLRMPVQVKSFSLLMQFSYTKHDDQWNNILLLLPVLAEYKSVTNTNADKGVLQSQTAARYSYPILVKINAASKVTIVEIYIA